MCQNNTLTKRAISGPSTWVEGSSSYFLCSYIDTQPRLSVNVTLKKPLLAFITTFLKLFISFEGCSQTDNPRAACSTDRIPEFFGRQRYSTCRLFHPGKYGLRIRTWCLESGSPPARACWTPACNPTVPVPPSLGSVQCIVCKGTQNDKAPRCQFAVAEHRRSSFPRSDACGR